MYAIVNCDWHYHCLLLVLYSVKHNNIAKVLVINLRSHIHPKYICQMSLFIQLKRNKKIVILSHFLHVPNYRMYFMDLAILFLCFGWGFWNQMKWKVLPTITQVTRIVIRLAWNNTRIKGYFSIVTWAPTTS